MPRWTETDLRAYEDRRKASSAKPKPVVCHEPVATIERKAKHPKRVHVSIVSFRSRLLDPDNLCPKYFIDCLRYAQIIKDDRPEDITLEVSQVKCKKKDERTEIEIT